MRVRSFWVSVIAVAFIGLLAGTAHAQSQIGGVVKDASGAVIPGVTVEAASPALIEKMRTVVSDDRGVYLIVDLRPGTYTVTFTLQGFQTFKREALELSSNFTATVNAEMKVGALEESVTVSGSSPVVDVQTTANPQVLNREVLDAVPTGRTAQTAAALVPGVVMGTPDVAGSNGMNQNASQAHGYGASDATVRVDGVQLQGMCGNGSTQSYSNVQNYEEIVVTNAGAGADVSGGGVRQNIIPKKGGNQFHGGGAAAYASGKWQPVATNPDLQKRGLVLGNKFKDIWNAETAFGGKVVQDRLWWYAGTRKNFANTLVADTHNADGTQGETPQSVRNLSLRLTNQVTTGNQLNVFYDRVWKEEIIMSAGYDPLAAEWTHPSPLYDQGQVKWTTAVSSRLFLEAGFNHYQPNRTNTYVPGCLCYNQPYESPGWFQYVTKRDTSTGTLAGAYPFGLTTQNTTRHFYDASASYVTGTHNIKAGIQDQHGVEKFFVDKNGDLEQVYQNGVPASVSVFNSSLNYENSMDHVWGVYAQDSWKMSRLTLNYGLRYEDIRTSIPEQEIGPTRFVPATRTYNGDKMPVYKSWNPRLGAIYDLTGDGKTAVKFSANKYQAPVYDTLTNGYNPLRSQSASVTWNDLNHDDIATENEMNLAQLPANFGSVIPGCSVIANAGSTPCANSWIDPNRKRGNSWLYSVGVQREVIPGMTASANWFHTIFGELPLSYNTAQQVSDYTPVQIVSPLDGSVITMYNVSSAARTRTLTLLTNSPSAQKRTDALEFTSSARLIHGAQVFGGITMDRTIQVQCDDPTNPNNLLYCDQSKSGIPWLINMKVAGTMTLPKRISLGVAFQSYRYRIGGGAIGNTTANNGTQWLITPTTRYAANCTGPCTPGALVDPGMTVAQMFVPLVAPGTEFTDRIKQVDINVGKWIQLGPNVRVQPEVSLFNALNNLAAYQFRTYNYGTSSYFQPSTTLLPRTLRFGMQVKW